MPLANQLLPIPPRQNQFEPPGRQVALTNAKDESVEQGSARAQAKDAFSFQSMFEQSPHLLSAISVPDVEADDPWCQVLYQNAASRQRYTNMQGMDMALQPSLLAKIFAIEGPEAMQVSDALSRGTLHLMASENPMWALAEAFCLIPCNGLHSSPRSTGDAERCL